MTKHRTVRQALRGFAISRAMTIWGTPDEFRQLLLGACPGHEREIELIVTAINCEIVSEMRRLGNSLTPSILLPKLIRWLMRQTKLEHHEAKWTVLSWAMAIGMIPYVEGDLN